MRRSVAILSVIAVIMSLAPLFPFVPVQVALGSPQSYVCEGIADGTGINKVIAISSPGDVITVSQDVGVSYCQIDVPIVIDKALTLQGQGKDVTYLKGPGVQNVAADVAAAQAKAATAKAAMKSALTSAQATLSTSATQRTRGSGPAPASAALGSGGGNGLGGGASSAGDGRQGAGSANQSAARGDSRTKATAQRLYDAFVSKWVGGQRASTGANALATVNTSTGPGIGVLDNLGTVTIQNFTITGFNNTGVDDAGGAIFVGINTPVVIQNNAIRLNSASRGGGVALLSQNDNSQITNNVFENNIAESSVGIGSDGSMALEGGAIWVFSNSQNLVISGNRLTSNAARGPGGAVAVGRANANALISGNTCQSSVGGPGVRGDGEGGCVKVTGGGFGGDGLNDNLMVTNNSFLQNSAATDAGALHIGMGNHNPTVTGNTFRENTTTGNAGALHIQDGVTHFTVSANTFERNLTGLKGGAMEIHGGVSTCTNASVISGNTFTANSALRAGGAIRTRNDAPCLTLTGNTYTNNTAARAGGAVQFGADFGSPSNNALFQNETFSGNSSASGSSCRDGGGAIHFRGSVPNLTIVGSSFTGNSSFKGGGAIDFDTGCDFSNEVLQPAVTIQNTLFLTNSAQGPGGAVEFDHHMDTLLIQNVLFQGNSSTNDAGGAIAFNNNICCSFTTTSTGVQILSTQFVGNSSIGSGGGILFDQLTNGLSISGPTGACAQATSSPFVPPTCSLFQGNKSTSTSGGALAFAVAINDGTIGSAASIQNTTFDKNSAFQAGGALSVGGPSDGFQVIGNTFSGNNGDVGGGAIDWASSYTTTNALIKGNTFDSNKTDGSGGAVSFGGDTTGVSTGLEVRENGFTRNSAQRAGGAFLLGNGEANTNQSPNATIHHNWFGSNTAGATVCCGSTIGAGGGLEVLGEVPGLRVYDNVLTRNTSLRGGGNFAALCTVCTGTSDMQVYNNTFTFGSAPTRGGGVLVQHTGADTVGADGIADSIAFWNNVAYLNTAGDFAAEDTSVRAFDSVIGTTVDLAICDVLDVCLAANPQFVNAAGDDFHIQLSSPAVDLGAPANPTGEGTGVAAPADDYDHVARVGLPDAGAYEARGETVTTPTRTPITTRTPVPYPGTAVATDTLTPTETPTGTLAAATPSPCVPGFRNRCPSPTPVTSPTAALTATSTATNTAVAATSTATNTAVAATSTATNTAVAATSTATLTRTPSGCRQICTATVTATRSPTPSPTP